MRSYNRRFRVRQYELDFFGHVNNAVYVQYMQEAAIEASTDAGFGPVWYASRGAGWVIRRLAVRYHLPALYGDELEVKTWISGARRASATREYTITRSPDGARVARARAEWIYVSLKTGQPLRLPAEVLAAFDPSGEAEDLDIRLQKPQRTEGAHRYRSRRRVQTFELDTARHVNHAVYLNWVEQAYFDALRAAGHPSGRGGDEEWRAVQGGHEIEYLAPAFDGDEVEVVSWVCEMGRVRGAWTHEIRCTTRGVLLAREYSLGIFVNREGRPTAAPANVVADVLRGPLTDDPSN